MSVKVSVLFSEPKIPQFSLDGTRRVRQLCFSALQRAENSSIRGFDSDDVESFSFQCSSASRKFLNAEARSRRSAACACFSALQRAENSSIDRNDVLHWIVYGVSVLFSEPKIPQSISRDTARDIIMFQCSSASRKFLNRHVEELRLRLHMFQCSSASRKFLNRGRHSILVSDKRRFSALQRAENSSMRNVLVDRRRAVFVSVLFSEPKIPQFWIDVHHRLAVARFSALQRAENSSISTC